ncbi:two-component system, response regulator YesN [Cohnella sp. OV330]|uniref:response regulator n=1 Tax=Cohnella sp. OV330 TaxID=1855288 RepID=UPI0008E21DD1|nr:response regulator [Cohnella sp. OV330]SFB09483.1 two-component system, response regulator YesN [Cohnella sp. OV330]
MTYKVLIVDDEPWSREIVKDLADWEGLGLAVAGEAEDGEEGLRRIGELAPDIVVTDMRMPGLSGTELLNELGARFPAAKIVVMSGYDDFAYLKQAIRSKAVDYLLKPLDPAELNAALTACVRELDAASAPSPGIAVDSDAASDELARGSGATSDNWRIPTAFGDSAVLERYALEKRRIYGRLQGLDRPGIEGAYAALGRYLARALTPEELKGLPTRLAQDALAMLETFASEQGIDIVPIWSGIEGRLGPGSTPEEAAMALAERLGEAADAAAKAIRARSRLDLDEIRVYIDAHFAEELTLESLSHRFFVSKEHLSRAFKAHVGTGVTDYVTMRRMVYAESLLREGKVSIKQAAKLSGYEDLAYFYRVFKRRFGFSPGELRSGE